MIELTPNLNMDCNQPLYIQLSDYIKQEIASGKINPNEKLPSKRNLANYLGLSLNTIQAAYDQLCAEGYVISKQRQGFFAAELADEIFPANAEAYKLPREKDPKRDSIKIDFSSGKVDLEHFPYRTWRKLTLLSLYKDQGNLFYTGDPQGEKGLREEIASYLFASRGVRCTADQIIIGAGTQALISLVCLLIGKNHTYAMENPGFHRTRTVFQHQGIKIIPISLDADGISIKSLRKSGANVAYVTPSHQFPYGMVMPIKRRMELLMWAESNNGYIIEDDYDGEYRYIGKPIPSLQGLDAKGKVVYLGTFSKSLIPSIRISYLVLPPKLMQIYQNHFTLYKQTASRLHQDTLYRFMIEGWQSHLNKMRTLYRKKHEILISSIKKHLGDNVKVIGEKSGLHIVLEVNNGMTEGTLISNASKASVKVYPLSIYYDGEHNEKSEVILGFGGLTLSEIEEGVCLLKEAWDI